MQTFVANVSFKSIIQISFFVQYSENPVRPHFAFQYNICA